MLPNGLNGLTPARHILREKENRMKSSNKDILCGLLTDLICAQDAVTHMNEKPQGRQVGILDLIVTRNRIRAQILNFVTHLVDDGGE